MNRFEILNLCNYLSLENNIPLEELWFDNQLTFLGGLLVVAYLYSLSYKILDSYLKSLK